MGRGAGAEEPGTHTGALLPGAPGSPTTAPPAECPEADSTPVRAGLGIGL